MKNVTRRPDAKEGGREEEKNRLGISTGRQAPGRPRNIKTDRTFVPGNGMSADRRAGSLAIRKRL
jgi:hypothetical protein